MRDRPRIDQQLGPASDLERPRGEFASCRVKCETRQAKRNPSYKLKSPPRRPAIALTPLRRSKMLKKCGSAPITCLMGGMATNARLPAAAWRPRGCVKAQ